MNTKIYVTFIIALVLSTTLYAQSSADTDTKANEIAKKYFDLPQAKTSSEELTLVIIDSKNNKRVRLVKSVSRDTKDGTESYIEFLSPADVKGSKFLNIDKTGKDSEQRYH